MSAPPVGPSSHGVTAVTVGRRYTHIESLEDPKYFQEIAQ